MKKINLHNYESFAVDFLDGNLNAEARAEFETFLRQHPAVRQELYALKESLPPLENSVRFKGKKELKKEALPEEAVSPQNCDLFFIAYHENDLGEPQRQQTKDFLRFHPGYTKRFNQYAKIKFEHDSRLPASIKRKLKKSTLVPLLYRSLRVAAAATLLISAAWFATQTGNNTARYNERTHFPPYPVATVPVVSISGTGTGTENENTRTTPDTFTASTSEKEPVWDRETETAFAGISGHSGESGLSPHTVPITKIIFGIPKTTLPEPALAQTAGSTEKVHQLFAIRLPRLFGKHKAAALEKQPATVLKFGIPRKKSKMPGKVEFFDLGPLKVYKKQTALASKSPGK